MTVLSLRFPAGRFHATPWGRHVNEGAAEWPPSPWRLLRALLAVWYAKAPEIPERTARRLLDHLADAPPAYTLPPASLGHTRHYLPFNEGSNEKKTKVFDAFIHLPEHTPLLFHWETDLELEERRALAALLERLNYFGRAESLIEAQLLDPGADPVPSPDTLPMRDGDTLVTGTEIVRLLAPMPPGDYTRWREGYLAAAAQFALASDKPVPGGKKPSKSKKLAAPVLPPDLFAALHADTGELQSTGWVLPPGAQPIAYVRSARAFDLVPVRRPRVSSAKTRPTVARYALASAVLPRLTAAVSVADRVHQSLVKWSGSHPVFTGLNEDGQPRLGHDHAHILCEVSDRRDAITHLTLFAREGFDAAALLALRQLNKVWGHGGHDLQLVLLGVGQPGNFAGPDSAAGQSAILQAADEWVSLTPFIPTRHEKFGAGGAPKLDAAGRHVGGAAHDLLRLLDLHWPGTEPEIIAEEPAARTHPPLRWLQFQRRRTTGNGLRAGQRGFGFRVRFNQQVAGPIAAGYGAHFGLGLFQSVAAGFDASRSG